MNTSHPKRSAHPVIRPRIAFLHGGSHAQLATLADPALSPYELIPVHLRDLALSGEPGPLADADGLVVSDRLRADLLEQAAPVLRDWLNRGNPTVVLGENDLTAWLPEVVVHPRPTIFWWWRTGEPHRMTRVHEDHPAHALFSDRSLIWHSHGVMDLPEDATPLVDLATPEGERDGALLAVVPRTGKSPLLVATMDPVYHHGSGFMPGATQLLYRSLVWLRDEILRPRAE